jgi:hypothetical protein
MTVSRDGCKAAAAPQTDPPAPYLFCHGGSARCAPEVARAGKQPTEVHPCVAPEGAKLLSSPSPPHLPLARGAFTCHTALTLVIHVVRLPHF